MGTRAKRVTVSLPAGEKKVWDGCEVSMFQNAPVWAIWQNNKHVAWVPMAATLVEIE